MSVYEPPRVDGRELRPLSEPGSDALLSDDVLQRIRLLVMEELARG